MPDKEGDDEKKSTKSVVNKKQKQMMGEEVYDIARDMGKVKPSKDKKDATTMPVSDEVKKTQKVNKGPSAFELVKAKYGKSVMNVGKKKANEELDLTKVAEAFGGYIVEQETPTYKDLMNQQKNNSETPRKKDEDEEKLKADKKREAKQANTTVTDLNKRFKGGTYDSAPFARRERQYDTSQKDASGKVIRSKRTGDIKKNPTFLDQRSKYNVDPKTGEVPLSGVDQRFFNRVQSAVKDQLQQSDPAKAMKAKKFQAGQDKSQQDDQAQQADARVADLMKRFQSQKVDTTRGKESSLYKTLDDYTKAKNPTMTFLSPAGSGKPVPMPGGYDSDGGRLGTKKQQKAYDAAVQKGKDNFFDKIRKGGIDDPNLPVGGTETNRQFKYDKAQLDIGGKISPKASAKEMEQTKKYLRKRGFKVPGETKPEVEKPKKDNVTIGNQIQGPLPAQKTQPKPSKLSVVAQAARKNPAAALAAYDLGKGIIGKITKLRMPSVQGGRAGFRSAGG